MRNGFASVAWVTVVAVLAVGACAGAASEQSLGAGEPDQVVATVGTRNITLAEVDRRALLEDAGAFTGLKLHQALYEARRQAIEQMVAEELLELEARTRGTTEEAVFQQEVASKVAPVQPADVAAWYEQNRARVGSATLEQVEAPIRQLLEQERHREALSAYVAQLSEKTPVRISLEPSRIEVATGPGDPSLGPATAPVEIIVFSEFQCPFCARANPTIKRVLETYGDAVRLVFKDFPLPSHAQAFKAAEAARCAETQGRFWEYHDVLFANQSQLMPADLRRYAAEMGLDTAEFDACLDEGRFARTVEENLALGQAVGVSATPTFFINGRLMAGAQPFEAFQTLIDDELQRRN